MAAAVVPPGAGAADRVVGTVDAPTHLSGYAGGLVWSSRDPATGLFALMYTDPRAGRPARCPFRSARSPFDADIGPGPSGTPWIVYSRCQTEPPLSTPLSTSTVYTQGRGCRLYRFDLTTGEERRFGPPPVAASDVLPSIWRGRVAFARVLDRHRNFPYVYGEPCKWAQRQPSARRPTPGLRDNGPGPAPGLRRPAPFTSDRARPARAHAWRWRGSSRERSTGRAARSA